MIPAEDGKGCKYGFYPGFHTVSGGCSCQDEEFVEYFKKKMLIDKRNKKLKKTKDK